jgi:DNA topoisomerase IB
MANDAFLNKVKQSDDEMILAKKQAEAKLTALQKLQNQQPIDSMVDKRSYGGTTLNKRQFGPYELTTSLQTDTSPGDKQKFAKLLNAIKLKGNQHSEKDAELLAKELKSIDTPINPEIIKEIMNLDQDSEYIQSVSRESLNKPLWYK